MLSAPRTTKAAVLASRSWSEPTNSTAIRFGEEFNQFAAQRLQQSSFENGWPYESFQRLDQTDDGGEIFGAGAAFMLMSAAQQDGIGMQRRPEVEQASALRAVKLVGADGDQIRVELAEVFKRFLPEPLDGVACEKQFPAHGRGRPTRPLVAVCRFHCSRP